MPGSGLRRSRSNGACILEPIEPPASYERLSKQEDENHNQTYDHPGERAHEAPPSSRDMPERSLGRVPDSDDEATHRKRALFQGILAHEGRWLRLFKKTGRGCRLEFHVRLVVADERADGPRLTD
jgi:hypothetical protein